MNKKIIGELKKFRDERNWKQFHTNSNLAKSIVIEAAEVLELFQWEESFNKKELESEIADVASYLFLLADKNNIDIEKCVMQKIEKNKGRFPINSKKESDS